ncbi:MAG: hypothetical protein Q9218_003710 [Villophora microphyllina]
MAFPSILPLLSFITLSFALICDPPGGILPEREDCQLLVDALLEISRLPGPSTSREWGRRLPNTDLTQRLPKLYWIAGPQRTTCGIEVDVDPLQPLAIETFDLGNVSFAAEAILEMCFLPRSLLGMARIGRGKAAEAKMVKIDKGPLVGRPNGGQNARSIVGIGREGVVLWSSEMKNATTDVMRS